MGVMPGANEKNVHSDEKIIDEILTRGVSEVIQKETLRKDLLSGRKLRIKLGSDPTSPNLHLGRAVSILKLRDFQELGHQIVFIVGDATGVIGDTSDKESERPMLSKRDIEKNTQTYFDQVGRVLDIKKTETKYNSEWLSKLTYEEIGAHADMFSVADFIARENIKKRLDEGKRVSLREVLYPLMQGYDSFHVKADVEIGGTDQRFNLLAGRKLQESLGQTPQNILMTDLIEGTDGRKMSSSWGNTIDILDEPVDMYGKVMSLHDELIEQYFISCTRVPLDEIESITQGHPKEAKMNLAHEIVSIFHSDKDADSAEESFVNIFAKGELPSAIPEVTLKRGASIHEALSSIVSSKLEVRRLVEGGAIEDSKGNRVTDINTKITNNTVFKVGKRRFIKVIILQ